MHVYQLRLVRGREMESIGTYISNQEAVMVVHEFTVSERRFPQT